MIKFKTILVGSRAVVSKISLGRWNEVLGEKVSLKAIDEGAFNSSKISVRSDIKQS